MIEVYYGFPSIYGRKVLTVLEEKKLSYQIKLLHFHTHDHLKEDYLRLNPNGEIPTLVDEGGGVVYESTAIIEYLNEKYPNPPLMPLDPLKRAQVRMIDDYCDLHLYPRIRQSARKLLVDNEPPTADDCKALSDCLARVDGYLQEKSFLAGEFTLADCAFMPVVPSLEMLGIGHLLCENPIREAYCRRLKTRPGYQGAELRKF